MQVAGPRVSPGRVEAPESTPLFGLSESAPVIFFEANDVGPRSLRKGKKR
jgi:hypothetical protein